MRKYLRIACLSAGALFGAASQVAAAAYPAADSTIRFVIGFPAGSSIDNSSRIVLDDIRARTNATIVVENKPGALGLIGISQVASAAPDGYTLMPSSSATHSSGPFLSKAFDKYDAVKDFTHIGRMMTFDVAVVTNAESEYRTAQQLIDAAKQNPGHLTSGYGSGTGRVVAAAFASSAGMDVQPVPYKGQPAAVVDLIGGRIDFVAADLGALMAHIKSGKIRPVAVVADERSSELPDTPTVGELGLSEVDLRTWIGVSGPAGLAAEVIEWWQKQIALSLEKPDVQEKLKTAGMKASPLVGQGFQQFVQAQHDAWGKQIKEAGITPE